ncbi:MAG: acetyltransferase [Actinobacteria bacterium]|nr:acetyltransferase [Actinomycetota bacterium]
MPSDFGLLGNGGQAAEAAEFALPDRVLFRAVTGGRAGTPDGGGGLQIVDIATSDPDLLSVPVVAALGTPGLRRALVGDWGGDRYRTIVAAGASVSPSADVGDGSIVAPGAVLTAGVRLGRHVIVNVGASVSHGSALGDYATLGPGARVAGDCRIGAGVFVGIGAVISNGVSVASGVVIGAGAVVIDDIDVAGTYVGVPARLSRPREDWLFTL